MGFDSAFKVLSNVIGQGHARTGHEGREREERYSSTPSLTSALVGVGGQRHFPAVLPLGMTRQLLYRRLGSPQGGTASVRKTSPQWDSITGPFSQSLYLLRYSGPQVTSQTLPNYSFLSKEVRRISG